MKTRNSEQSKQSLAISYIRYSDVSQRLKTSHARQLRETERFCKEHNLKLINRLEDLGISGWDKSNLSDTAALGGLLKDVEAGRIPKGTHIVCENLDRLTRSDIFDALNLFSSIIKRGITVVTTMDGKWYSKESILKSPADLMVSIVYLMQGHAESEKKSERVSKAWVIKHEKIARGEFSKFACPSWLEHDGARYNLIPSHAATIRVIFDLYLKGHGVYSLIRELNKRDIKPFTKTKTWTPVFLHRLLQNPAVIGTCVTVSPHKENYFPRVISDEIFYRAINRRKQNQNFQGKRGTKEIHLYGSLGRCRHCGSSMVKYTCKGKGDNPKQYNFLVCSQAKVGKCSYRFTPFEKLNDSFLALLRMVHFTELLFSAEPEVNDDTETIAGKLADIHRTISRVSDAIIKTESSALVSRLAQLELDRKQLEKDLDTAKANNFSRTDIRKDYKELFSRVNLRDADFRLRLRNLMRRHLSKIVIDKDYYTVHFAHTSEVICVWLKPEHFELTYWDDKEQMPEGETYVYDYQGKALDLLPHSVPSIAFPIEEPKAKGKTKAKK